MRSEHNPLVAQVPGANLQEVPHGFYRRRGAVLRRPWHNLQFLCDYSYLVHLARQGSPLKLLLQLLPIAPFHALPNCIHPGVYPNLGLRGYGADGGAYGPTLMGTQRLSVFSPGIGHRFGAARQRRVLWTEEKTQQRYT